MRNIALAATGGLVVASIVLVLARRPVAGWLIETYLAGRGVESSVQIDRLEFARASAALRIGSASAPTLRVEKISVFFSWQGWSPRVATVDLYRPELWLQFDGTRISLGALQDLIGASVAQSRTQPSAQPPARPAANPAPERQMPTVSVKEARLHIVTPDGTAEVAGSGRFADGGLAQLNAAVQPLRITLHNLSADIQSARVWTDTPGELHATARGAFATGTAEKTVAMRDGVLALEANGLRVRSMTDGAISVSGRIKARLRAERLVAGSAAIRAASAQFNGSGTVDTAARMNIAATLTADGGMTIEDAQTQVAKLPALGSDPAAHDAVVAALRHFTLRTGGVHVLRTDDETNVVLKTPTELTGDNGTKITLTQRSGPFFHADAQGAHGAGSLTMQGPRLPSVALAISNYRWSATASGGSTLDVAAHLEAEGDFAGARDATLSADGHVSGGDGKLQVALDRCAEVRIASVMQKRSPVLRDGRAQVCDLPGQPLFFSQAGAWRLRAGWKSLAAQLVSAQALVTGARGQIALSGEAGSTSGTIDVTGLRLSDGTRARRFAPVTASGRLTLAGNLWRGRLALSVAKLTKLGTVTLVHSMQNGHGRADIRLDGMAFSPDRAQPSDLSRLLAPLAQADGKARFTGEVVWTARGMTSGGDLVFQKLDFLSPLGRVHGAEGRVHFVSLAPLQTARDQIVKAAKVDWTTPLSGISATFKVTPAAFTLSTAQADMAGGQVNLGPVTFALPADHRTDGAIRIRGIDIGALVAASNLAKKISLTARVSGTVPFRYGPQGLRFTDGRIATVGPGRLSIARSLWTGATEPVASGGAVRDFAYQAMEDLAIEEMEGTINSLPNGRLGMIFRIKGRYDPKKSGTPSVDLFELLQGTALDKPIPLPKGTEVNLTLDTNLNFDELLAAYRRAWAGTLAKDGAAQPQTDQGRKSK